MIVYAPSVYVNIRTEQSHVTITLVIRKKNYSRSLLWTLWDTCTIIGELPASDPDVVLTMVLVSDGNSEIGVHGWSDLGHLICVTH